MVWSVQEKKGVITPRPAQDPSGKCPILLNEASLYRYDLRLPGSETRVDEHNHMATTLRRVAGSEPEAKAWQDWCLASGKPGLRVRLRPGHPGASFSGFSLFLHFLQRCFGLRR